MGNKIIVQMEEGREAEILAKVLPKWLQDVKKEAEKVVVIG